MNSLFSRDLCAALVLSFGHFLWIGTLIAAVSAVAVRRRKSADARYRVWLAGLIAMATSPFVTLVVLMSMPSAVTPMEAVPSPTSVMSTVEQQAMAAGGNWADTDVRRMGTPARPLPNDEGQVSSEGGRARVPILQGGLTANSSTEQQSTVADTPQREPVWWRDYAPLVTQLYLIGVALMGLRLTLGLWGGRRLRNRATLITDRSLLDALQRQAEALRMKFVPAMAYCEKVTVPTVLGILKPMILLPVSVASGLTPEQVESVLAHELAHLKRYDHLVNLMQCVIESLLFFHPAVWWVSRRIRDEREHCCDDLVIACGTVPLDYAASLLRVAELSREAELTKGHNQRRSFTAVSLFATGDRPSTLRQRIARLLGYQTELNVRAIHPWTLCCLALFCLGTIVVLTRVTWIALAEINRDRTQTTVIVEWSAVVDESLLKEILALKGKSTRHAPDAEVIRLSGDELRAIVKGQLGNKRFVLPQNMEGHSMPLGGWRRGRHSFQMIANEFIPIDARVNSMLLANWFADGQSIRDEESNRVRLSADGNYNFGLNGKPPITAKIKFDETMSDGDATVVVLTPPSVTMKVGAADWKEGTPDPEKTSMQDVKFAAIFVHEAVRVPVTEVALLKNLSKTADWIRRGAAGTKEDVSRITEWRARPSHDVFDKNAKWTHAMPHGGEIQLVGLGLPNVSPKVWWTPDGEPLKGVGEQVGAGNAGLFALLRISETGKSRGIKQLPGMITSNGDLDVAPHLRGGGDSQFVVVPVVWTRPLEQSPFRSVPVSECGLPKRRSAQRKEQP